MFLDKDQLARLTGMQRASAQIRYLHNNGWRFIVNGLGEPVVCYSEVELRLVGSKGRRASNDDSAQGPDWDALKNDPKDVDNGTQASH